MSTSCCWRRAAVGAVACACALISPRVRADESYAVPCLSGHVYLDINGNHQLDEGSDWAIKGAAVTLTKEGGGVAVTLKTDQYGFYSFDGPSANNHTGLAPGVYDITLAPYTGADSANNAGQFESLTTGLMTTPTDLSDLGAASSDGNAFRGIKVTSDMMGMDYNFGKAEYPLELASKQMLLTTSEPIQRAATPALPPLPSPEPGTLGMLAFAGLGVTMVAWVRRRNRRHR
jgi:hypothetical protein